MTSNTNGNGRFHIQHAPLTAFPGATMTSGAMALMNTHDTVELLGRLDERTRNLPQTLVSIDRKIESTAEALTSKIDSHDDRLGRVETAIESLSPVKRAVYGGIALILTAVITAAMGIILSRTSQDTKTMESIANKVIEQKLVK